MGELRFIGIEGAQDADPPGRSGVANVATNICAAARAECQANVTANKEPEDEPGNPLEDAGGFVKLYRKALDSPELSGDAVSLGLFVTLLLLARWRPGTYKREPLQAGQLAVTLRALCKQTGLSIKQVKTRLALWHESGTIRAVNRANRYHVISICNYRLYQDKPESQGPTEGPTKGQPRADQGLTNSLKAPISEHSRAPKKERRKEERNTLAPSALSCGFEGFWKAYPKKRSKGQAEKAWRKADPAPALSSRIMAALETAKASPDWKKDGGQFIPYPASWLNARGWEDELDAPEPSEGAPPVEYFRAPNGEAQ